MSVDGRLSPSPAHRRRRSNLSSSSSDNLRPAVPKTKAYMDSLVPPDRDQFEHIAHVQAEKESETKRRVREERRSASLSVSSLGNGAARDERDAAAARVIQKTFRGYRARREMQGYSLDASTRWVTAIREAQFRQSTKPRAARVGADDDATATPQALALEDPVDTRPSNARSNWKKASIIARRAGHDDLDSSSSSDSEGDDTNHNGSDLTPEQRAAARRKREAGVAERKQAARMMGLQYFLEMVDSKHRYGSNLRMYHEEWKKSDTNENFFYWLDYGGGKQIELDTCPRDRLEREQVRYLSREERQYYLVRVDDEGRLCWAKTGARIDTTEAYKDSIHGIVPADDPTPAFNPAMHPAHPAHHGHDGNDDAADSDTGSASSEESRREADRAAKYADSGLDEESHGVKKVTHISASTIFNKMLRKSVRKNTWIFVADTSFRLYVGIKDSGAFQHSSFLQGSRISAAGLIKIKNGRLSSLSPLSGHYRPPASNFRAFVRSLKDEGTDMSHVSISKSYTVLVGLETYVKTRRKGKDFVDKLVRRRDKMVAPDEFRRKQEEGKDKSESAEKERRVLERQRRDEEAARADVSAGDKVVQKLKSIPTHVKSGGGGHGEGGTVGGGV
ncbi:IQ calmodulin-binding motif protein [Purpureocillium lavendulum]|uniref:IQ calmodulin-binding motif protein n=1 Tax=Purpureocillium lavendulum TaxID=1247861 RepID=A0AB34FUA5_9HYPO|nr:IQ calmodulin-binding motif protein [Purpureocillium lavendulum]